MKPVRAGTVSARQTRIYYIQKPHTTHILLEFISIAKANDLWYTIDKLREGYGGYMEIRVIDEAQETISSTCGDKELNLVFEHEYQDGDKIIIKGCEGKFVWLLLD